MSRIARFIIFSLSFTLLGCAPKLQEELVPGVGRPAPLPDYAPFATFGPGAAVPELLGDRLGTLSVGDSGLSLSCDYAAVLGMARTRARALGANALVITEHRSPNLWSTCHRITATLYRMSDAGAHETEIVWHPARRLTMADFRGDTVNRPFLAATSAGIGYRYRGEGLGGARVRVTTAATFFPRQSYLKRSATDARTLAHEQLHFDIAEIFARRLVRRIAREFATFRAFEPRAEQLLRTTAEELGRKQDEYDSEVYADPDRESFWAEWVARELAELDEFADRETVLKSR